jgi:hypothetical protein
LPDGIFSFQKFQFGCILEGLEMENVGIFLAIWNILQLFGLYYGNVVVIWYIIFHPILLYYTKKNLATLLCKNLRAKNAFSCFHLPKLILCYVG